MDFTFGCTELRNHLRIQEAGASSPGASIEGHYLPIVMVFSALVGATDPFDDILSSVHKKRRAPDTVIRSHVLIHDTFVVSPRSAAFAARIG